jgi:hypothetical protein
LAKCERGDQHDGKTCEHQELHVSGFSFEGRRRSAQYLGCGASPAKQNMRWMVSAIQVRRLFGRDDLHPIWFTEDRVDAFAPIVQFTQ